MLEFVTESAKSVELRIYSLHTIYLVNMLHIVCRTDLQQRVIAVASYVVVLPYRL